MIRTCASNMDSYVIRTCTSHMIHMISESWDSYDSHYPHNVWVMRIIWLMTRTLCESCDSFQYCTFPIPMTTFTHSIVWNLRKFHKFWDTWDHLGPIGALSRSLLVKSEFFFFCVFSRYLCNEDSSVDPTLILPYSAPGLCIAQSIFRELLSVFSNVGLLRHVTSRHVLWQSIYSATRGHPMGTTYHHGWILQYILSRVFPLPMTWFIQSKQQNVTKIWIFNALGWGTWDLWGPR